MDWNKYVKVFNLDVGVQVKKEVTKADVILSLLDEGEIAFKGKKGGMFVLKINDKWDMKLIKTLIEKPLEEELESLKKKAEEGKE